MSDVEVMRWHGEARVRYRGPHGNPVERKLHLAKLRDDSWRVLETFTGF